MLRSEGWTVNAKRVERIWRREGLKVPQKQPKKGRLWLNDGSCVRLRPERPNHVWSYDFVEGRTHNGRRFRMLNDSLHGSRSPPGPGSSAGSGIRCSPLGEFAALISRSIQARLIDGCRPPAYLK